MQGHIRQCGNQKRVFMDETSIILGGKFFVTKKDKVYLKKDGLAKACKVTFWPVTGEGDIQFLVPRKLPIGFYDVIVSNSAGSDPRIEGFEVK